MPSAFDSVSPSVQSQLDAKADSASLSTLGGTELPDGMAIQYNGTTVWMPSDTEAAVTPIEVG